MLADGEYYHNVGTGEFAYALGFRRWAVAGVKAEKICIGDKVRAVCHFFATHVFKFVVVSTWVFVHCSELTIWSVVFR